MIRKNLFSIINFVLLLLVAFYIFFTPQAQNKTAYVLNQKIFNEFKGKKELEQKLGEIKKQHHKTIDSIMMLMNTVQQSSQYHTYQAMIDNIQLADQQLSNQYTADIWKNINSMIVDFGKENGYDYIFGGSGDGSLMYAGEAHDITPEVVEYINRKYND